MPENSDTFESWAIVELMGHRKVGGYVISPGGPGGLAGTLRVDIHEAESCDCMSKNEAQEACQKCAGVGEVDATTTQFYGSASIYCLTPTTEETARQVARGFHRPIGTYQPAAYLEPPDEDEDEDADDDYADCDDHSPRY